MIQFEWLWAFIALPLPWLFRLLLPAAPVRHEAALRVPFIDDFQRITAQMTAQSGSRPALLLAALAWLLLVVAAARPQWHGEAVELPVSGRDLMLAVDLSGSMRTEDFMFNKQMIDRLQATQLIAGEFIERRVGDRLGLILFGEHPYIQTPLTFDRKTVQTLLYEAAIGLAGEKKTAIGDAIGLVVKHLGNKQAESQVLILLTDGANTDGQPPLKMAELAAEKGLKIYTIGIGADEMIINSFFGNRRVNPSGDLDEKTLRGIAEKTGGRYFRARDTQELAKIYALIDQLEPVEKDAQVFRPLKALYMWPLGGAMLLACFMLVWRFVRNGFQTGKRGT